MRRLTAEELDYYAQLLSEAYARMGALLEELGEGEGPHRDELTRIIMDATRRLRALTDGSASDVAVADIRAKRHQLGRDEFTVARLELD